jgi:cytochrome P450
MNIEYTYGEFSHFKFGRRHVYLVNNPERIENILVRDNRNFIKSRGLQASKRLLGEGLVTSEGEYHDKQRRIIQPTFHPSRVKGYGRIMIEYTEHVSNSWQDGDIIDIHTEMMHLTSEIIAKSVLGSEIADVESDKVNNALLTTMEHLNRVLMPFGEIMEKIPILPENKKFRSAKSMLDSLVYRMIKEHRDAIAKRLEQSKDSDLLDTLIIAQDPEAAIDPMTDVQLRDEVMTLFLAGHETTANALTWTFYLLSQNPEVEQKLFEELQAVLGDKRAPTVEDVQHLEYTEKVFRESMRLYPPAWTLGRQVLEDYTIDNYVIPKGSIILMSQYVMHHNPKYFPNPHAFDPDRWTRDFKSNLPRFSYFPFGGGIRSCVGEPFAWMEGILALATICRKWKMHHDPLHKVELKPLITLRPKYGMRMKLEKRG